MGFARAVARAVAWVLRFCDLRAAEGMQVVAWDLCPFGGRVVSPLWFLVWDFLVAVF